MCILRWLCKFSFAFVIMTLVARLSPIIVITVYSFPNLSQSGILGGPLTFRGSARHCFALLTTFSLSHLDDPTGFGAFRAMQLNSFFSYAYRANHKGNVFLAKFELFSRN